MKFLILLLQCWSLSTSAFAPLPIRSMPKSMPKSMQTHMHTGSRSRSTKLASSSPQDNTDNTDNTEDDAVTATSPWNPELRKIMTGVASLGALETAYLTATKLGGDSVLCTVSGSCQDVLNGPYAVIPFTDNVPLSALGCAAYTLTALVAVAPLLVNDNDDDNNRIALLILTTGLGTFSTLLMFLLTTVLHESCLYCLASASLSWTLCASAWFGGILPDENDEHRIPALQSSVSTFLATAVLSVASFSAVSTSNAASADEQLLLPPQSPPVITTTSSPQALAISKDLALLNAKMYGVSYIYISCRKNPFGANVLSIYTHTFIFLTPPNYRYVLRTITTPFSFFLQAYWCGHCFDQKQFLGKEAYTSYQYIECSKDGVDSQNKLCKERNVPGYPTWEINGKLYPGEQELDELQDIIATIKKEIM